MDNRTDVLYLDVSGSSERVRRFLCYLAAFKNVKVEYRDLARRKSPAVCYMGVTVGGLPAVTEFLLSARAEPELLPSNEHARAAALRDITGSILLYENDLQEIYEIYRNRKACTLNTLSILELAVASCASPDLHNSVQWINRIAKEVDRLLPEAHYWAPDYEGQTVE